ncbi:MAG: dipeptidase [Anaerolineae bacterium]|jgi:acetylornithine deacetylase/succinyl-diaminopimelate desuccinylase-like protein|nr:dipeptidase [Anaerolineae bacterium]
MTHPLLYAHEHQPRFLEELKAFLRIPSISAQPVRRPDVEVAAEWLRDQLRAAGFPRAEVLPTGGHPVVYAEWLAAGPDAPTVLTYGHYDVQPPDPALEWLSPPFEPTVRGENLYARGASDDKGQLYAHVKAAEAYCATVGAPPVNLKVIVEGEEEIGSPNLDPFIEAHRELLAADVALISDSHILAPDTPSIVYALRGLAYLQVEVEGPAFDLHSGIYGGAVNNPLNALCRMLAGLQDAEGRVLIPGFYDAVRPLDAAERAELARVPFDREAWLEEAGVSTDWGDPDYTVVERATARPTLDINGIWGGYIEAGAKTVLPSKAYAKMSMRLVPDQDPAEIARLVREHLERVAPPSVSIVVRDLHGGSGAIVDRNSPAMRAAAQAYAEAFGSSPVFVREGGSIPVVATFQRALGIETVLMGFGLPDDRLHSPNEKLYLPNFTRGVDTVIRFFDLLARAGQV